LPVSEGRKETKPMRNVFIEKCDLLSFR
jgi:hypothetical protein